MQYVNKIEAKLSEKNLPTLAEMSQEHKDTILKLAKDNAIGKVLGVTWGAVRPPLSKVEYMIVVGTKGLLYLNKDFKANSIKNIHSLNAIKTVN
jgi:hypothetical protein